MMAVLLPPAHAALRLVDTIDASGGRLRRAEVVAIWLPLTNPDMMGADKG